VRPIVSFEDNPGPKQKPKDAWKKPKEPSEMDKFKHYDILTLKKLVIEEIKNELELAGHGKQVFPGISRPGYVDPFTRTDMTIAQASQPGDRIQIKGEKFAN
jgi:hypothetical protein